MALREDEVAAVSMGIPSVRTKLSAYAIGAAFGGMSGAFLGTYYTTVNAGQFQFGFSIFILAMVIIGGLGSIWGALLGGMLLGYINNWLIPDVLNDLPQKLGLNFSMTEIEYGIFGFLLVLVMLLRPQGLIPERRRKLELTSEIARRGRPAGGEHRAVTRHQRQPDPGGHRRGADRRARLQGVRRPGRRQRRVARGPACARSSR